MNNKTSLKILLTNHHLISYQGSENFTLVIADALKKRGHDVFVYSAYIGKLKVDFEMLGIPFVTDLRALKDHDFDIIHTHHQINAYEVRYFFPHVPIILLCHGIIFLENPPLLDLRISKILATSERVKKHIIKKGISEEKILIFRNMVDRNKFFPLSPIHLSPRRALVLSNKIDSSKEKIIREASKATNITPTFIGERFRKADYSAMPYLINDVDIVFSLGRGAIESMLCARVPIIFDYEGGDGMVTPSTIFENMTCNFSGNLYNIHYTVDELVDIIRKYKAEYGEQLRQIAIEHFAADKQVNNLIEIYRSALQTKIEPLDSDQMLLLESIVLAIAETRSYSHMYSQTLPSYPYQFLLQLMKKIKKICLG